MFWVAGLFAALTLLSVSHANDDDDFVYVPDPELDRGCALGFDGFEGLNELAGLQELGMMALIQGWDLNQLRKLAESDYLFPRNVSTLNSAFPDWYVVSKSNLGQPLPTSNQIVLVLDPLAIRGMGWELHEESRRTPNPWADEINAFEKRPIVDSTGHSLEDLAQHLLPDFWNTVVVTKGLSREFIREIWVPEEMREEFLRARKFLGRAQPPVHPRLLDLLLEAKLDGPGKVRFVSKIPDQLL